MVVYSCSKFVLPGLDDALVDEDSIEFEIWNICIEEIDVLLYTSKVGAVSIGGVAEVVAEPIGNKPQSGYKDNEGARLEHGGVGSMLNGRRVISISVDGMA